MTPRLRRDGLCLVCQKPRRIARPPARTIPVKWYTREPFCSSTCARLWHGVTPIPAGIHTRKAAA